MFLVFFRERERERGRKEERKKERKNSLFSTKKNSTTTTTTSTKTTEAHQGLSEPRQGSSSKASAPPTTAKQQRQQAPPRLKRRSPPSSSSPRARRRLEPLGDESSKGSQRGRAKALEEGREAAGGAVEGRRGRGAVWWRRGRWDAGVCGDDEERKRALERDFVLLAMLCCFFSFFSLCQTHCSARTAL